MRKIKIIIVLMLTGKLLFAQCEYIEDSTTLRVIGSASAPSCIAILPIAVKMDTVFHLMATGF
ncbi:MAG: hypothetical protein V9G42_03645 [Bacteroidia bacterium]